MSKSRPVCAKCGSKSCYTNKDFVIVCRVCQYRSNPKLKKVSGE